MKRIALALIRLYQMTWSQVMPPSCRFMPTCSHYAYQSIDRHGFLKGAWLGTRRLSRCHPFNPGGYDPVPEKNQSPGSAAKFKEKLTG